MLKRFCWFVLPLAALIFIAGCGGGSGVTPEADSQSYTDSPGQENLDSHLVSVRMHPQAVMEQPFRELSWSTPTGLAGLLPPLKQLAWLPEDLVKNASDYEPALPSQRMDNSAPPAAVFSPAWDATGNPASAGLSFAMYRFALEDYDQEPAQTIGFTWTTPPADFSNLYVALGNIDDETWDWFAGPADDVLTIESFTPYIAPGGDVLLAIVLTGTDECELEMLRVGDTELRSLGGLSEETEEDDAPPLSGGGLPGSVDLTPGCSPVRDQGQVSSCTAFAIADGAYNYELGQIYGEYGWDFSDPFNLVSPRYMYVETGKDQGLGCPNEGRYLVASTVWLRDYGIATEQNAPYGFANPPLPGWCHDTWPASALADAELLSIEFYSSFNPATPTGVLTIKSVIANQERPVILGIGLDEAFLDYESGVWNYTGPLVNYHTMLIVGYDDSLDGGNGAFKVRNSWSDSWGEAGYAWIGYDTLLNYPAGQYVWCNTIRDEYDADVADRFLGTEPELAPPTGVTATDGDYADRVDLTWEPSTGATGYMIYRDSKESSVAMLGDVTQWSDTGLSDHLSHVYWVRAFNPTLQSGLSAPDTGYLGEMPLITSVTPRTGYAGQTIAVNAAVSGSTPLSYSWNFGGGATPNTSTLETPEIVLATEAGDYSASLTVSNDLGSDQYDFTLAVQGLFQELLIIYNSDMPEDLDLVEYYSSPTTGRAIDPDYRLGLPLGADAAQTISREDYGTDIRDPILAFIDDPGNAEIKSNIKYLLMMKGVPYKIPGEGDQMDWATSDYSSVDSELCTLRSGGVSDSEGYPIGSYMWNASIHGGITGGFWLQENVEFTPDIFLVTPYQSQSVHVPINYLVGRLSGYTYDTAKAMVDRSLAADTSGTGWIILDTKAGSQDMERMFDPVWPTSTDSWDSGYELLTAAGFNVVGDETSDRITSVYASLPTNCAENILTYCSWGVHSGFAKTYILNDLGWTYRSGACFMSYESFNATTMRCSDTTDPSVGHPGQGQIADFLHMGGTVAIGNAYEPFTSGVGDERWVFDRYVHHGDRWIEAAYKGLVYLSWQEVVVGDPLCRVVAE